MRKAIISLLAVALLVVMPLSAQSTPPITLPTNLLSGSIGMDFDYDITTLLTFGFLSLWDTVDLRAGYGGVPKKYEALALGGDVNIRKLTRGKVQYTLGDTDLKIGLYWLPERAERVNDVGEAEKYLIHHFTGTLALVKVF